MPELQQIVQALGASEKAADACVEAEILAVSTSGGGAQTDFGSALEGLE